MDNVGSSCAFIRPHQSKHPAPSGHGRLVPSAFGLSYIDNSTPCFRLALIECECIPPKAAKSQSCGLGEKSRCPVFENPSLKKTGSLSEAHTSGSSPAKPARTSQFETRFTRVTSGAIGHPCLLEGTSGASTSSPESSAPEVGQVKLWRSLVDRRPTRTTRGSGGSSASGRPRQPSRNARLERRAAELQRSAFRPSGERPGDDMEPGCFTRSLSGGSMTELRWGVGVGRKPDDSGELVY